MEQQVHQMRQLRRRTEQHEQPVQRMRQEQSTAALDVLLKHPAVAADQQSICSMLQVSKGWRAAVQNSGPGLLSISVIAYTLKQLALAGFGVWLPKHYQLVSSIEVHHEVAGAESITMTSELVSAACTLQSANNSPHWQLRSFRSDATASNALLLALPAGALTELRFSASHLLSPPAVARFSELKQLDLGQPLTVRLTDNCGTVCLTDVSGGCGASTVRQLAALSKLTRLSMCSINQDSDLSLLPGQLQDLRIRVKCTKEERPHVLLQHLTALQRLDIISTIPIAASLPPQLQQLSIHHWRWEGEFSLMDTFGITDLQQLQQLELGLSVAEPLQSLSALTQLQHVKLEYQGSLENANSIWGQFPALSSLDLLTYVEWPAEIRKITRGLAAATGLTSLRLELRSDDTDFRGEEESMYKPLSHLTNLRSLSVVGAFDWSSRDWPDPLFLGIDNLSVLTRLTKLGIFDECFAWALTAELSQLLSCLIGLEELAVRSVHGNDANYDADYEEDEDEWHFGLMPVVGQLQQLRELDWRCGTRQQLQLPKADAQQGLGHLVGLSKLTNLVGFNMAGPKALDKFWATVTGQQNSCVEHAACSNESCSLDS